MGRGILFGQGDSLGKRVRAVFIWSYYADSAFGIVNLPDCYAVSVNPIRTLVPMNKRHDYMAFSFY